MIENRQIYNSRITKNYINFLAIYYPHIDIDQLIEFAGMTRYEVEDPAHWFTQQQVDRFHEILVRKTGDPNISREVGRFLTSSKGMGVIRQYTVGFLSPTFTYLAAGKVVSQFSKNATITTKKLGSTRVEIVVTPKPGVWEKRYQCENRIGSFESMGKIFTGKYARVEHPECYQNGQQSCRYVVSWDKLLSRWWKLVCNYTLFIILILFPGLFFYLPQTTWTIWMISALLVAACFSMISLRLRKNELINTIKHQRVTARDHLNQLSTSYNNALLMHEIGKVTASVVERDDLIAAVVQAMAKRLDFDRGVIMLADENKSRLVYASGYGYNRDHEQVLRETEFHLDQPDSKGFFVRAFKDQKPFLLDDVMSDRQSLSDRSRRLAEKMEVKSLICVPIVYENESLGILAVDNLKSKRPLTQSDMNLLTGIASQTAVSIINARSFKKLKESEEKYRNILESIEDGYFEVDKAGNFTFFNEATCKMLGYPKEELMGMNNRQYMNAETARQVYRAFNVLYQTGNVARTLDSKMIRKDGSECFIQMVVSPIYSAKGKTVGFRGIARDITERIRAEKEKKQLEARLQQAEKMEAIGTLAGGVAHDLNNVLSGLINYPELLLMDLTEDSPLIRPIKMIQKSGERATAIVQDLLTLARRGVAVSEVINLNHIIVDSLGSPEYEKIKVLFPGVEIDLELAENLLNMLGSPVHLSKSLMNIITNAAEAMPDSGKIIIKTQNQYLDRPVRGYDDIEEGEYVVLSVADTGVGITAEDIKRIFEPFYTKKVMDRSGSGLGMAVVWGTVKDHKGYIDVESRPGSGSTFRLYFPVTRKALVSEKELCSIDQYFGHGESILIVDDVVEQREIAAEILKKLGYSVACVPSGEAAVQYLTSRSVDLVVLDMIMDPGIDGLETYTQILAIHPKQKAIIASGYSETAQVKEAQKLGAGPYLKKPYTTRDIGLAVHTELEKTKN
jgi:PAS domain S-box-containing protein